MLKKFLIGTVLLATTALSGCVVVAPRPAYVEPVAVYPAPVVVFPFFGWWGWGYHYYGGYHGYGHRGYYR